jgi:beta-phosphoglucomutase-like phosphatase (HAD superfamily)
MAQLAVVPKISRDITKRYNICTIIASLFIWYTYTMIDFEVKGVIFDVDDTILDNKMGIPGQQGLHERSRLAAVHEIGKRRGISVLEHMSIEDNKDAFASAPIHTIESAVWNMFVKAGIASSEIMDEHDPILLEIIQLKDIFHKDVLLEFGEEVPGAVRFIRTLAKAGLENKLAIASTAIRRDVDLFLSKVGLHDLFPNGRIKTKEDITHPKPPESDRVSVCAFEDDPRGIMAARAAGLYVCAIATRFGVDELMSLKVPPHMAANSYAEFTKLFHLD